VLIVGAAHASLVLTKLVLHISMAPAVACHRIDWRIFHLCSHVPDAVVSCSIITTTTHGLENGQVLPLEFESIWEL
jgi:hypothetical protein